MVQLSSEIFAARRARWLSDLSAALSEARRLMRVLDGPGLRPEALELCAQIDTLRWEVSAMQLRNRDRGRVDFDPKWINSPWHPPGPVAVPSSGPACFGEDSEIPVDA